MQTVDMGGAAGITSIFDARPADNVSVELRERWRFHAAALFDLALA